MNQDHLDGNEEMCVHCRSVRHCAGLAVCEHVCAFLLVDTCVRLLLCVVCGRAVMCTVQPQHNGVVLRIVLRFDQPIMQLARGACFLSGWEVSRVVGLVVRVVEESDGRVCGACL